MKGIESMVFEAFQQIKEKIEALQGQVAQSPTAAAGDSTGLSEEQKAQIQQTITTLGDQLTAKNAEAEELRAKLAEAENVQAEIAQAQARIAELQQQIAIFRG